MKFEVKRKKEGRGCRVSFSDALNTARTAVGEDFDVTLEDANGNLTRHKAQLIADGKSLLIGTHVIRFSNQIVVKKAGSFRVQLGGGHSALLPYSIIATLVRPVEPLKGNASAGGGDIKSPMTGKVLKVFVKEGDTVAEGDVVVTIEAMKMENRVLADCAGTVKAIRVEPGQSVTPTDVLFVLLPAESKA